MSDFALTESGSTAEPLAPNAELHPLRPFIPESPAQLLMLGSFPPPRKRWTMDFFYPNYLNDMWRIFGVVFRGEKDFFVDLPKKTFKLGLIKDLLNEKGIAIFDTATAVVRLQGNASDKFLRVVRPTDVGELLQAMPSCRNICATGEKSAETVCNLFSAKVPQVGEHVIAGYEAKELRIYRMPSSSRAYPLALFKKAEAYKKMFSEIGIL